MPRIKNNASGQISDVDQTTIDQIKANASLSQNYTFFRDEEVAPTPPEVQEQSTVKKDEGQQQASPISSPQQQEQAPQQEAGAKAANKNSKK